MTLTRSEPFAEQRAREAVPFAEGLDQAGFGQLAGSIRLLASDVTELLQALEAERSARVALQADRDRLLAMLAPGAADAA